MIDELKRLEDQLKESLIKRSKLYDTIRDMTVSAGDTQRAVGGLKRLTAQINSLQNEVNACKKKIGYHLDEIKKTEIKNKTRI
jgi:regulator of replication initiation timing|tara:strand:- start:897 stop:1145 length:249 start_codon:yes stop_codon:yes gene_type:complete